MKFANIALILKFAQYRGEFAPNGEKIDQSKSYKASHGVSHTKNKIAI